jgi:hypothetical protein
MLTDDLKYELKIICSVSVVIFSLKSNCRQYVKNSLLYPILSNASLVVDALCRHFVLFMEKIAEIKE